MRLTALVLAAALPATALAAPAPQLSWGKPGVSLATYRAEAIGCGMRAYYTDVANTNGAKNFQESSRLLETYAGAPGDMMENARMMGRIVESTHVDASLKDVKQFQVSQMDKCLLDHGYHRFRLTEDQRKHLEKLKIGSDARHAYLHRLAADPDILRAQAAPDPTITATN
jgi:hypothetical protein